MSKSAGMAVSATSGADAEQLPGNLSAAHHAASVCAPSADDHAAVLAEIAERAVAIQQAISAAISRADVEQLTLVELNVQYIGWLADLTAHRMGRLPQQGHEAQDWLCRGDTHAVVTRMMGVSQ
ncbi:MAG: hypothetical protein KF683_00845 [Rubrivivax sp.]|nr:hypothetical protein [Rubrivivax sp.]